MNGHEIAFAVLHFCLGGGLIAAIGLAFELFKSSEDIEVCEQCPHSPKENDQ